MTDKDYLNLELNKVLEILGQRTSCQSAKKRAMEIRPSSGFFEANELLSHTNNAYMLTLRFGAPSFTGLEDMSQSLKRASSGGVLSAGELLKIAGTLSVFRGVKKWREHSKGVKTSLDIYFDSITTNKYLEEKITTSIISEEEIADTASDTLFNIRKKIKANSEKIREKLEHITHSKFYEKYLQEHIITIRNGRYVIPIKAEHKGDVSGLVHDTSSSGSTLFIEPMAVVESNNAISELKSKEEAEIDRILLALSCEAGSFAQNIISSFDLSLELDLIFAKANLAADMKASMPKLNNEGRINIEKARHPLIAKEKVVPINIRLGIDFDTLVITGPNTGGKTVSLKTVGLLTLMAMCGMMIPAADNSEISVFNNVFTDIGDEQSIEQSLSTFSSHIKNIIKIVVKADEHSLVLLDELGSGTDPIEGAALGMAIIEELRAKGCKIISSTHYAQLKTYALQTEGVENACCEFDVNTLKPTYRLLIGVPGRSNAFAISESLGLNSKIIERAKEFLSNENTTFENVIRSLEEKTIILEKKEQELDKLNEQARGKVKEANEKLKIINREIEKDIAYKREQAEEIVRKTLVKSERLINELEMLRKNKKSPDAQVRGRINKAIKSLEEEINPINKVRNSAYKPNRDFRVGDFVYVESIEQKAEIISVLDKNNVLVKIGAIRSKVKKNDLRLIDKAGECKSKSKLISRTLSDAPKESTVEIDVRGKSGDEAIIEIDGFIDGAVLRNIKSIRIIHGKGTGVLRNKVRSFLKGHSMVKSYRIGEFGEGDTGVTVAEIK